MDIANLLSIADGAQTTAVVPFFQLAFVPPRSRPGFRQSEADSQLPKNLWQHGMVTAPVALKPGIQVGRPAQVMLSVVVRPVEVNQVHGSLHGCTYRGEFATAPRFAALSTKGRTGTGQPAPRHSRHTRAYSKLPISSA
jgi:hypothetical protein